MAKRVELLAPCGSYESFLAAVNAGADAVYLGGRQFGARAYAENFSREELVSVIENAHLFGVKIYLTVNTLVKEREFSGLYEYMAPLYEAGLDGAIVQDMGVFCFLKRHFPGLKLHASTQMTITGVYGAAYLREMGCERIVPARELSLGEIEEIKRKVPVEIEAFIHGAMCYCYSGQCLMSSMIGGRSGNRGRCAGPCRLPYRAGGKEGYYLSLKDMNTLEHIPELIEAGIDSFKIEGRMKKPEYVAGVVSVYRKYIDRYYRAVSSGGDILQGLTGASDEEIDCRDNSCSTAAGRRRRYLQVEERDKKLLSGLYIRSETGYGYYEKKNGRDMLTLHKPGYNETDQRLLEELRKKYIHELAKTKVRLLARCRAGEPLYGEVCFTDRLSGEKVSLSVSGAAPQRADKRTVSGEEIRRQLVKTGGTPFAVEECIVETGENVFVPMSHIKTLRRDLLRKICEYYGARGPEEAKSENRNTGNGKREQKEGCSLTVLVQTRQQFDAVFSDMCDCAVSLAGAEKGEQAERKAVREYLIVDADLFLEETEIQEKLSAGRVHWGLKCPVILRKSDGEYLRKLRMVIEERKPGILYCGTMDVFAWVRSISYPGKIAGEASLYAWNREAVFFWGEELERVSIPLELESGEVRELCSAVQNVDRNSQNSERYGAQEAGKELLSRLEAPVYGRAPFMVSANCIKLSAGSCDKNRRQYTELTDRLGNIFPVYTNCSHCYNIIYNCLPTSYYESLWMLLEDGIRAFRVEFTTESGAEAKAVTQTFRRFFASELKEKGVGVETTQGRFRRGVE